MAGDGSPAPFVAVVGTVNHDVIVNPDGRVHDSLGGILYNAIPLAALLEGTGVRVRTFGRLGKEHRAEAAARLAPFPAASAQDLIVDANGTNLSRLDYRGGADRVETVEMRVAPLSASDLAPVAAGAAVLVNMISGRDVEREVLADLRARSTGLFFLDVQALARTTDTPRRSRIVPDGPDWAAGFDVVRGNEDEIAHLGGTPGDPRTAAKRLLDAGAGEVLVTRGKNGAWRFDGSGSETVPAFPCANPVDPTGCGDAFLAGVVAGRVRGLEASVAARLGAYVASRVAGLSGLESFTELKGLGEAARAHVPGW